MIIQFVFDSLFKTVNLSKVYTELSTGMYKSSDVNIKFDKKCTLFFKREEGRA